jgi:acyl-CoA synthetase (NDP forming)
VSFCVAEALENAGRKSSDVGHPDAARVRTALLKNAFATAMDEVGFPTPAWATPFSLDDAQAVARQIGYPVVLKPRTGHVLAIMDSGAYFVPFSTTFSFPKPAIVLQDGDRITTSRRRESFDDVVALDALDLLDDQEPTG